MALTVQDLVGQIEEHHLMPSEELSGMKSRWFRPERKEVEDVGRFTSWLRANNYLTDFALTALTRGKADRLTLNQYRLTDLQRTGPEAGDFLAIDPVDRVVRVRIVSPAIVQNAKSFEQLSEIVQKLMGVPHPGVARVLDFGQASGVHYLVTEHVDGESLEETLKKRGKLNYHLAARIFAAILEALGALQQQGVRAGQLSGDGLILATVGKGTGGARTMRLINAGLPRVLFDSTAIGMSDGERPLAGRRTDGGADSQSLGPPKPEDETFRVGALLYQSVTGHEPYPSGESSAAGRGAAPVQTRVPEVPDMLAELIDSMIDPVPANRPTNAAAIAKALRVFLKSEEQQPRADEAIAVAAPTLGSAPEDGTAVEPKIDPSFAKISLEEAFPSPAPEGVGEPDISRYFRAVVRLQGSDLHLAVGNPPMVRLRNVIRQLDMPSLTQDDLERLVAPLITLRSQRQLDDAGGADFAYIVGKGEGRFRVNLFKQRGHFGLVARRVNSIIPTFEKLGLPPVLEKLCLFDQGMVIVAGVTGSGKSTTLAAMLDYINEREQLHILTIEDPIEYLFTNKKAVINQREVGIDVADWKIALKHAVRQDPDVILVGEMRDRETFEAGINAAETGHLVFCTIHASSAASTIGRILDLFPADMHPAMRQSLAFNLKAIICQKLLPSLKPGVQRVPTNEIMIVNPTIRELIIKGEDKKLPDALRIGMIEGMMDFNESLRQLAARGDVDQAAALEASPNPEALKMAFKGIKVAQPGIL
jgi:twitching motility protein PilT